MSDIIRDGTDRLKTFAKYLAKMRRQESSRKLDINQAQKSLEMTDEFYRLNDLKADLKIIRQTISETRLDINDLALDLAEELFTKEPAPGVTVTRKTTFEILDDKALIDWCVDNLRGALRVDLQTVSKLIQTMPEDFRPHCVRIVVEEFGAVRVSSKLEEIYLEEPIP